MMARLVEVQQAQVRPSSLSVRTGDVLLVQATGGRVQSGGDVVEMLGPFLPAVLGEDGSVVTPMGAPNTVLLRAHRPGRAIIDVVTGDPWHAPQSVTLSIVVEV
jgi:hypothetical protein